jgi:hypothetical protein
MSPRLSAKHSSAPHHEVKPHVVEILCESGCKKFMLTMRKIMKVFQCLETRHPTSLNDLARLRYAAEAAAAGRLRVSFSDSSQRTLTSFDTPGSCMVTP